LVNVLSNSYDCKFVGFKKILKRRSCKLLKKTNLPKFTPKSSFLSPKQNVRFYATDDSGFHDDFKAKVKKENPLESILKEIENVTFFIFKISSSGCQL
jgi:hypothetical protein